MMGGRAAEFLVFEPAHHRRGERHRAGHELARRMVCELGHERERSGPLTFGKKEEMVFLGKEIAHAQGLQRGDRRGDRREVRALVEGALHARR